MDTRTNMIIAKGKIVTADVSCCALNPTTNKWDITFKNGKDFHYSRQNVSWLRNPTSLNPSSFNVRCGENIFDNIEAIFSFNNGSHEYWHLCFFNGYEYSYDKSELQIREGLHKN